MIALMIALLAQVAPAVGNDEPKKNEPKAQQPENPAALSAAEWKELRESNIFAPPKKKVEKKPEVKPDKPAEAKKPDPPPPKKVIVTGFFHDDADKCFKVVIEDRTFKDGKYTFVGMKMLKAGDEIAGGKIGEVRIDSFDHMVGETKKSYKTGEELVTPGETSTGATGPSSASETPAATKAPDAKSVEEKLKELRERNKGKRPVDEDSGDESMPEKRRRK
jgi:hypothetical protein